MSTPVFRNPDKFQLLPHREWIRAHKPTGTQGYVVEDLDLVLRVYGRNYLTDDKGRIALVELKFGNSWIGYAQRKTFGELHRMLRAGDAENRYIGFFVIQYSDEDWDKAEFAVNKTTLSGDEFARFLSLDALVVEKVGSLFDGYAIPKAAA